MRAALVTSPSASVRRDAAREALAALAPGAGALIVAATRAAADELAADVARARGASFGIERTSFYELAIRLALPSLARDGLTPNGALGAEAVAARATFEARSDGTLDYFAPVAHLPGFPRAVTRTLAELQMAGVEPGDVALLDGPGRDLAALIDLARHEARRAGTVPRATVLRIAADALSSPGVLSATMLVLLDVPVTTPADEALLRALLDAAPDVMATVPDGDDATLEAFRRAGITEHPLAGEAGGTLSHLQRHLFAAASPAASDARAWGNEVQLFSAPGEGREAVEIARRVLAEAARGVPFDKMAVLLRAPHTYFGLVEHAFARADVPAWFDRGTRRPDPAGRAFLALLACADEQLSARRFAEYLSLGQVPDGGTNGATTWVPPGGDMPEAAVGRDAAEPEDESAVDEIVRATRDASPEDAVIAGTLRAPWRWESLLAEALVIHKLERWRHRLGGLEAEYARRIRALADEEPESPRLHGLARDHASVRHLRDFALPIVDTLAGWTSTRVWGEWLRDLTALAPRVLRRPTRVLRVLAELAPLESVGPVSLREVREVLSPRLLTLNEEPPRRRHGRVFVGTPEAARGRVFDVVFVPGMAERLFPQRLREDALLLDGRRRRLEHRLPLQDDRAVAERLHLRLAVGAAARRLYLSYPRIEVGESRPRVPSFYVLDVARAVEGRIPNYQQLARQAAADGDATLAWPAPTEPARAIDDLEHDLSMLHPLLRTRGQVESRGRARYLLELSPTLRRSATERWARWQTRWHTADGLIDVKPDRTAPALAAQRLTARPYSLSALQRFAACPYQFVLAAMYRLSPLEQPAALERLDPLTRGSLFHEIQTAFFRALSRAGDLPVTVANLDTARDTLERVRTTIIEREHDRLAPAIERVWDDEMDVMARDLRTWLDRLASDGATWIPERFELGFGLPDDEGRDPHSTKAPVIVGPGFHLRGSIDLVERKAGTRVLRVTDHKTGKNRTSMATVVDGGRLLQPVLYSLALEQITGDTVESGRLSFCTSTGGFSEHVIPLDEVARRRGLEVLEIVDRAIELGTLAARPADKACDWCDYRAVCGPLEPRRTRRKPAALHEDLDQLRRYP
ncbi:MAG: PD-(D/E)XK nuclease family protein [Vicinamibacterales bacterium]|nr:PD-(D/E)XK nuclease family protein [Vicinamibacterales bacterium]